MRHEMPLPRAGIGNRHPENGTGIPQRDRHREGAEGAAEGGRAGSSADYSSAATYPISASQILTATRTSF